MSAKSAELLCPGGMNRMDSGTMKIILSLLIGLGIISPIMAVEYVTLNAAKRTHTSDPNDVIQIVTARISYEGIYTYSLIVDGVNLALTPTSEIITLAADRRPVGCEGIVLSGVTNWSVPSGGGNPLVVLRITKPNEGFKSEPLVVPVSQGTSYSVALETSTDMQTWVPAAPGDYASTGPARFFRVKAAVTPGTP